MSVMTMCTHVGQIIIGKRWVAGIVAKIKPFDISLITEPSIDKVDKGQFKLKGDRCV